MLHICVKKGTKMTIGERLAKLRGNESRNSLAVKLDIHPQTLYLYEKNKRSMDAEMIAKVCELYTVSADWLIFGVDRDNNDTATQEYINELQRRLIEAQEQLIAQLNK